MSEVRWAETTTQQAEDRRQVEKSEDEKRQSKAAFEKRLQQDRTGRDEVRKQQQTQTQAKNSAQEARSQQTRDAERTESTPKEDKTDQAQKKDGEKKAQAKGKDKGVLAHVRQQAAQQQGKAVDRRMGTLQQQHAAAAHKDMERTAQQSGEQKTLLGSRREEGLGANKGLEKSRAKDLEEKDKVKDKETQETKAEQKAEAQQTANTQQAQQAGGANNAGGVKVDADGQRQQNNRGSQGGGQNTQAEEAQATKGPSAQSLQRAHKATEIQKLCEKLLDNYYVGCAPDGSAMMRMELKEGVLAGLVVELKVDDRRQVAITLSGGNKEAIDFVTSSRGELARALGRKGLNLASMDSK